MKHLPLSLWCIWSAGLCLLLFVGFWSVGMRPGSAEIIEHYRELADRGEPLTPDPDDAIPMLPGEDNALRKIEKMDVNNLDRAIDRILSDEGTEYIEKRITELESELAKLKKLQKALLGKSSSGRTLSYKIDPHVEAKVVAYVKKNGPCLPGEIGKHIKQPPINVGRLVAASGFLTKRGANVVLIEAE